MTSSSEPLFQALDAALAKPEPETSHICNWWSITALALSASFATFAYVGSIVPKLPELHETSVESAAARPGSADGPPRHLLPHEQLNRIEAARERHMSVSLPLLQ